MNIIPLKSDEFEDLTGQPIYLTIFDQSGKKIYAAKADLGLLSLLSLQKGNVFSFSTGLKVSKKVEYEVIESNTVLVREAKFHQIHIQLIVNPIGDAQSEDLTIKRPQRVFRGPQND